MGLHVERERVDVITREQLEANPGLLDTQIGVPTDVLWELSLDTSWIDEQDGNVDEGLWFARMGRYMLYVDSAGFKDSEDCGSVELARRTFEIRAKSFNQPEEE